METYEFDDALTGAHVACRYPDIAAEVSAGAGERTAQSVFFPGCSFLNYMMPLVKPVADLLEKAGIVDGTSLLCCGKILEYEPDGAAVRAAFEKDFRAHVKAADVKRFVAACPNCVKALRELLAADPATAGVEVVPLPQVLADLGYRVDEGIARSRVERERGVTLDRVPRFSVHDSCPDRDTGEFAAAVRTLMGDLYVEQEHHGKRSLCCGSTARAAGKDDAAVKLAVKNGKESVAAGADAMVMPCVSCVWNLTMSQNELPAFHYLELLFDWRADWAANTFMKLRFLFDADEAADGSSRAFAGLGAESEASR